MRATRIVTAAMALMAAIQVVPYGRHHDNPPVAREPLWDRAETRALASRACFDCHSNETSWPWYSNVAPVSWLLQHDVDEGRATLNFSEWNRVYEEAEDASDTVREGDMPLTTYTWLHPTARLDTAEREQLARGLERTIGAEQSRLQEPQ